MYNALLKKYGFGSEIEAEYIGWMVRKRKKFIVWIAIAVSVFLLYFTFSDISRSGDSTDLFITVSLRVVEIFFTVCVVFLFLKVEPVLSQKLLLPCMLIITLAAVFDTYFWVKNINHDFNPPGQMFAVYVFMIIPFISVINKFILGLVFVTGMFVCSLYLDMPSSKETALYVLVIFISEVAISYRIDTLLRAQFKAIHDEKKQTVELKKREQELREALESEREAIKQNLNFIDMISHEYRTPLSVISSCVDSLDALEIIKCSDSASHTVRTIRESSRRLLSIYESSLHEKRINASGVMPYKKKVELLHVVEMTVDFVRNTYPEHTIFIDDDDYFDISVIADNELLTTALINILDNACKYSIPSRVDVVLKGELDKCIIAISDEGIGIADSEIKEVFEKYYRSGKTKQKPGAGVGLYLVKKIIGLHNGVIGIESSVGKGTKVSISLPICKDCDV